MVSGNCSICGETVQYSRPDATKICARMECRQVAFRRDAETRTRQALDDNRDQHQQQLIAVRKSMAASGTLEAESEEPAIGIVPFLDRKVGPADRDRQAEFLSNLRGFAETVLAPDYQSKDTRVGYGETDLDAVRLSACTACRGVCCDQGQTHAFFQPGNLEKLVDRDDESSLQKTIALYESYLPEESVEGSCVFHTSSGCALPVEHRSQTCNSFRCPQLRNIETLSRMIEGKTLLMAAVLDDELRNVQAITVNTGKHPI